MKLYKFESIYKSTIWGGNRLASFKGIPQNADGIGESWEISGVAGKESVVSDGPDKGLKISELIGKYKEELVGKAVYDRFGTDFPLLIKFIDARQELSVQVHPDDVIAAERHGTSGKTEMWYVLDAAPGATIVSGLRKPLSRDDYERVVADNSIVDYLARHEVKAGDVFYLPAGRIHTIGAGTMLAEIQQASDATYRIYDFKRLDTDGHPRELHTALAKDAIDYRVYDDYRTYYTPVADEVVPLKKSPFFKVSLLELRKDHLIDLSETDGFLVVMVCEGEVNMEADGEESRHCGRGETLLASASVKSLHLAPAGSHARLLLCTV